ncbi:unnamed protein product [Cuscuta epithymum]|uniref:Uncharacterized protein n=1 Tax=Cuscuta epithymum TaxID=186058 RepID=A0AAV0GJB8_9ASTE|nr:unnamed protein product [Cuscuta epithymum]
MGSRDWSSRIREMCVQVSKAEVICLLARSLVSESPISDVFLTDVPAYGTAGIQMKPLKLVSTFSSPASESLQNAEQSNDASVNLKVTLVKSTQEILFGEATNEFFDFMCSFLTTPIGSMMRVLEGQSGLKCMDNLYTSVLELDPNWFHSSNKCGLLELCIAQDHNCKKQLIKSFNTKHILEHLISSRWSNNFTVEPSMFLVPDDFEVKPLSATSSFLLLKKLEISFSQTEERCVTVGMKEAISLLKAALTSTSSALTKGLGPFLQKHSP